MLLDISWCFVSFAAAWDVPGPPHFAVAPSRDDHRRPQVCTVPPWPDTCNSFVSPFTSLMGTRPMFSHQRRTHSARPCMGVIVICSAMHFCTSCTYPVFKLWTAYVLYMMYVLCWLGVQPHPVIFAQSLSWFHPSSHFCAESAQDGQSQLLHRAFPAQQRTGQQRCCL